LSPPITPANVPPTDTGSQSPIFWERLLKLFKSEDERSSSGDPTQGSVVAVCLLISTVLWLALTLNDERTVTLQVPTRVVNLPSSQALTELPPSTVRVEMTAQGRELIGMYVNPPDLPLDADSETIDVRNALLLPEAANVEVVSVTPREIRIPTEPRVDRRIPVDPRLRVDLPASYELLGPIQLDPDSVTISGAASIVQTFRSWPTDSLTIRDVRDSTSVRVSLSDTLSQLVERSTEAVRAQATAGRFSEATREIEVEVTGIPSDQDLVALEPSSIRVKYRVLFDHLFEAQSAPGFFATVSYDEIRSDTTGFVRPQITVPSDLQIRDPKPTPNRLRYYTFVSGE